MKSNTELADALDRAVAPISPTPSGAVPIVEVSADLIREAARRLREHDLHLSHAQAAVKELREACRVRRAEVERLRAERDEARADCDRWRDTYTIAAQRADAWEQMWGAEVGHANRWCAQAREAEHIANLAMAEGLRECERLRARRDEAVEAAGTYRAEWDRAAKVVGAARIATDWSNGGVEHGARCAAYNGQIGGAPYICKCGMDTLRAALAEYDGGNDV